MKRMRSLLALLMTLALLVGMTSGAWAGTNGNGVTTPPLWSSSVEYDWYPAITVETVRTSGESIPEVYTFDVKANLARLAINNAGVRELDVYLNGTRLNLNDFFVAGVGQALIDISPFIQYGENAMSVQSLGATGTTATLTVEAPAFNARILHMNDIHAAIDLLPKAAAYIEAARAQGGDVFFVDAGDNFSGNPVSDLNLGVPMIQILNAIGTDVFAVGNHDFDHGPTNTQALRESSDFAWITANTTVVDQALTPIEPFKPYEIFTNGLGQKIAFVALTQTPPATGAKNTVGLSFSDPLATAQRYISELRDQVNLLVLVSHNGYDVDTTMAPELTGVDLIIGAHSHTNLKSPVVANDIPIVQVGSGAQFIGDLVVRQADGVSVLGGASGGAYSVEVKSLTSTDPEVQGTVNYWTTLMEPVLGTVIGSTATELNRDGRDIKDVSVGNLITDAMRHYNGAEIAVWNNGGIRASINAGDITMKEVYNVLPFANMIWKAEVTGRQLVDLLVASFKKYNSIDLQIAGASYVVYKGPDGSPDRIEVTISGNPMDLNRTYTLALSDYVATNSKYWPNGVPTILEMGSVDAVVVADYIKELEILNYAPTEGRIKVKASPTPVPVTSVNFYSTASLLADDGGALVPLTGQATSLLWAESTAYQTDISTVAPKNFAQVVYPDGTPIPLAAFQQVGSGKVAALGAITVSNGFKTNYQTAQWFINLLDFLAGKNTGTILVDQGHAQYYDSTRLTQAMDFLSARGWAMKFTGKSTPLTAEKLVGVDVLMITTPGSVGVYTADEIAMLNGWVAAGGKLIIASQADFGGNSNPTVLNTIAGGVGTVLRFNSDQVTDDTNNDQGKNYSPTTNEFNPDYPGLLKAR